MPPPLEHQVAIITGAASGIGLAIARRLADDGATVVIADINEKDGREAAEQIGAGKAVFQPLDVTTGGVAQAGGLHRHRPPCPDVKYWYLSPKAYAQWSEFGLFRGSWYERHKVMRRQRGLVVVREWRPFPPWRCA